MAHYHPRRPAAHRASPPRKGNKVDSWRPPAAASRSPTPRQVTLPSIDLRDNPTNSGTPAGAVSPNRVSSVRLTARSLQAAHVVEQLGTTNKVKTNPLGLVFFAYYRVFTRVPEGGCGPRREPFLRPTKATVIKVKIGYTQGNYQQLGRR